MKSFMCGLNFVLFAASFITVTTLFLTIIGEGYKGEVIPKDIYHICLGAIVGMLFTAGNMQAIRKKEKL